MVLKRKILPKETLPEEIFNALSHSLGIFLGIAALALLVTFSALDHSPIRVVCTAIYGATLILMFTASTLYHAIPHPRCKSVLKVIDHISIYLLIAGSYTPIILVDIGGAWGWSLFGIIWGLAFCGVVFKLFFTGRFELFSLSLYGIMGWLIVIALFPLIQDIPFAGLMWLLAGGLCYTIGIIFYVLDAKYHFAHLLWHILVLSGAICHFFAILLYVVY